MEKIVPNSYIIIRLEVGFRNCPGPKTLRQSALPIHEQLQFESLHAESSASRVDPPQFALE